MHDWNKISHFMSAVVPWPVDVQSPGYVNLHFRRPDRADPTKLAPGLPGFPFRAVDSFLQRAQWLLTKPDGFRDQYYCLSLQAKTKPNKNNANKPHANRLAIEALALKAIWIDCDTGDKKQYKTHHEAMQAMLAFRARHNLPMFSAVVNSGGGMHFYWISKTTLTVREWAPFADGLKALLVHDKVVDDPGLTTDVARVLRIPGTKNFKYDPPANVVLLDLPTGMPLYDFATDLAVLPTLAPAVSNTGKVSSSAKPPADIFFDDAAKAAFSKAVNLGPAPDAGLGTTERPPLPTLPIFKQCEFYRDALVTGGADHGQPLWNLAVLGTTWMEKGDEVAHAISKGHPGYTADATQALYDRKVAERSAGNLGWPSCASIAGNGSTKCASCPLFGKGKSPLNVDPVITATVNPTFAVPPHNQSAKAANDLKLPPGYDVDPNSGYICKVVQPLINGEPGPIELLPLFRCVISFPWCQGGPDGINFIASVDKGNVTPVTIYHADMLPMVLDRAFIRERVKVHVENKKYLEAFMVAWLEHLHSLAASQETLPFGWYRDPAGVRRGFAYGGILHLEDGSESACGGGDAQLRKTWSPSGSIDPWWEAARTITNQKRMELDAIIALAFSAPLTPLVDMNAMTLCAYGESGVGKSAAYSVGIAVWGDPKTGKQVSHSTFNSVMKTMGQLNNLPLYWDEIKDEKAQQSVYDFIYNASDGVEKGRQKADLGLQSRGTWSTQMMMAANISFTDYVMKKAPSHAAGVSRVLEYYVGPTPPTAPGKISAVDAAKLIGKLNTNFGTLGLRYAKMLAMHHAQIEKMCADTCREVEKAMGQQQPERMWVALVGTILVGANLANQLAAQSNEPAIFDEEALKKFLYATFLANRAKRDGMMQLAGARETTESLMSGFFAKMEAADTVIWVKGTPIGKGRPTATVLVHGPQNMKNVSQDANVMVRWDVDAKRCYINKAMLTAYLHGNTGAYGTHFSSLTKEYGMQDLKRFSIGAGTLYETGRQAAVMFENINPDHDWFDIMIKWSNVADKAAAQTMPTEPTVETGFADAGLSADDVLKMAKGV